AEPPERSSCACGLRAGTIEDLRSRTTAGANEIAASSTKVGPKPKPSIEKPVIEGPKNAEVDCPSEKVAKFLVRASPSPNMPMRLCTETWKKICPKPVQVAQAKRPGIPGHASGIAMPSAIPMEPAII